MMQDLRETFEIDKAPMYPNFPHDVMSMDEAEFRFHQRLHYLSTYGVEQIANAFGEATEVKEGWLPNKDKLRDKKYEVEDKRLLRLKTIQLVDINNYYNQTYTKIVNTYQRVSTQEQEILANIINQVDINVINNNQPRFKENIMLLGCIVVDNLDNNIALDILSSICSNAMDVLKLFDYYLHKHSFKIKTSKKKLFSKLLDQYSNLLDNLNYSNKVAKKNHVLLNFMDYSYYSRNKENIEDVNIFRDNNHTNFFSNVEKLINKDINKAISLLKTRPGLFLRCVNRLYNLGVDKYTLINELSNVVNKLSTQTIVTCLTNFQKQEYFDLHNNVFELVNIFEEVLNSKFKTKELIFNNKKVYIDEGDFDLSKSNLEPNDTSLIGEYITKGLAYKLPEDINNVRFFVYWNDERRVDVDLHAYYIDKFDNKKHVGWNADFKSDGIYFSGDITHSDASEFIDVDLNNDNVKNVIFNITMYNYPDFTKLDTCYCGLQAIGDNHSKLNDPKNYFFKSDITAKTRSISYAYLDVEKRILKFVGASSERSANKESYYSIKSYLYTLLTAQNVEVVNNKEDADYILQLGKPLKDNEISLIDNNYFLDAFNNVEA